ncbi:MAG: N-acetyl-gamma-glutamyl-phosphate reductase [Rhizobacter sp.]|nr:N-acetyl-gamma-glutamyl-phosphate reductase [Chlorobiales bacterium]
MHHTARVSVIGASGYSGAELTKLLLSHPAVELQHLYAHAQAGKAVKDVYPNIETELVYETFDASAIATTNDSDIFFLALPHGEALKIVPKLLTAGKHVIDLSGDFRLSNPALHLAFYKNEKPADAVMQYGLPELFRTEIATAQGIANPGCYATAITLGLAPLANAGLLKSVAATCTSGLSGAGKSAQTDLLFTEMSENVRAYKIGTHQHTPEVLQTLGDGFAFSFVPMVVPMMRGIYAVLTLSLTEAISKTQAEILYHTFYSEAAFARVQPYIPEVKHVLHTNFCDVAVAHADGNTLIVISTLDNLLKGAAGQAVQNMNLMLGLDERIGFFASPVTPRASLYTPARTAETSIAHN